MARAQRLRCVLAVSALVFAGDRCYAADAAVATGAASESVLYDYLTGNGLLDRGLNDLACEAYRTFLADHPDNEKAPAARYGLSVALFRLGRFDEARQELEPLVGAADFSFAVEVHTLLGQCRLNAKDYAGAAAAFVFVPAHHGDHELADDAAAGATESYYLAGDYENAATWGDTLVSRWPRSRLRPRTEYYAGLAELARDGYDAAGKHFASVLKRDASGPLADRAGLLLAQCWERAGQSDRAIKQYARVVSRSDTAYAADALFAMGYLSVREGAWDQAAHALDRFIDRFAETERAASAFLLRGRVYVEDGSFEKAAAAFDAAIRVAGDNGSDVACEAAYWRGKCALKSGNAKDAARRLDRVGRTCADGRLAAEIAYDLGIAWANAKEPDRAVVALRGFLKRFPDHPLAPDALRLSAITEHQQKHFDKSDEDCRAFIKAYPNHPFVASLAFLSAENAFLKGDLDGAVPRYEAFLNNHPNDKNTVLAKYRLGTAFYRMGRFDEAERFLSDVAEHAGDNAAFRTSLLATGDLHFQRGEWKQAERYLTEYLRSETKPPHADDALLKLGLAQAQQDRARDAIETFRRLIDEYADSPHRLQAMFETGQCLVTLGAFEKARAVLGNVVRLDKTDRFKGFALNHLAAIAVRDGSFDESAKLYGQVVDSATNDAMKAAAMLNQGRSLAAGGRFDKASTVLASFLSRYPDHKDAQTARAHLAVARARQDQCARAVELATEVQAGDVSSLEAGLLATLMYEKAWCLRRSGDTDRAASAYRALLDQGDSGELTAHAALELAGVEADAKHYEAAAVLLRPLRVAALKNEGSVSSDVLKPALYRLGYCAFELNDYAESAEVFGGFVETFPDDALTPSARYYAGESSFRRGRYEAAVRQLARVTKEHRDDPVDGPALLRLGEALAKLQRWSPSERAFTEYLDRHGDEPAWYQAAFGVGWARENQRRYKEAILSYEKVIARHKGPTAARAQFQIGECLFAQKQYAAAARELLKVDIVFAYQEWTAAALYEAGRCFGNMNQTALATDQFKRVVADHPDTRWATLAAQRISEMSTGASNRGG